MKEEKRKTERKEEERERERERERGRDGSPHKRLKYIFNMIPENICPIRFVKRAKKY